MHGLSNDPGGRYGSLIGVMKEMHWSWADLISAPADLVEEVAYRMTQESRWQAEKRKLDG